MDPDESGPLAQLARRHGILLAYRDATGQVRPAPAASLVAILRALGVPIRRPEDAARVLREASHPAVDRLPPILLWRPHGSHARIRLRPRGRASCGPVFLVPEGTDRHVRLRATRSGELVVPNGIPDGVHTLRLGSTNRNRERGLILAPPSLPRSSTPRRWGLFVPLYGLRDRRTWGCGDLRALESLGRWAARHGASAITTLPILPAFLGRPFDPSPYRPVSRRFWNEVYLDPTATPEFRRSPGLRRWVRSARFARQIAALERRSHVDFRRVAQLKRRVLERMLAEFSRAPPARRRAFQRFVERTEGLGEYARFRARGERDRPRAEAYHRFAQWLTDEQLHRVTARLKRRGVVLGLDLPLGIHPRGFDAARDRALYARTIHVGAPPDPGVPGGQDWGFSPFDPQRLRRAGYRPFAEAIRHEVEIAGLLRIDHVLGLHRLFWIPAGRSARDGIYVGQPVGELYGVVLAEAARAGAEIVGEDLGTVPPEVRPAMRRRGVLGVYVAELEWDGPGRPRRIPRECVASLNTHDHLPFAGFWASRQRFVGPGRTRSGFPSTRFRADVAFRLATFRLARSPARLLLVNVEDLWGETRPQNVPGERAAHFTRRFRVPLETLAREASVSELLSTLDALRRGRYARCPRLHDPENAGGAPLPREPRNRPP